MKGNKSSLCVRAVEYMLTRKDEEFGELTVAKIARALKVSQSYLDRLFRLQRNFPLREYFLREKMVRSVILLTGESDLTIKQLSEKVGFLDCNYFIYIFKNHFGISPARYRECKKMNRISGEK
ncbi:MAG: helix-turn-helix transcriptional regulator [Candidatus Aminicenantes bacterium]|nr:MAG: helix-turn-helix transcriptional regulator [Candidatus Aminicenantes bacterium]